MRAHCVDCGTPTFGIDLRTGVERCVPCKKKKLGREPREFTEEEVRGRVLDHIWGMIQYWYEEERRPSALEKMEGLAFSILVMLDGESADLPGFLVAPVPHPDDKEFSKKEIQDWYPQNQEAERVVNCDIAGGLHDNFHKHRPKGLPKEDRPDIDKPLPIHPPNTKTPLDTFTMKAMSEVFSHVNTSVGDFAWKAWPPMARYLAESTSKYHSGMFGDVKVMVIAGEGKANITLWRNGKELILNGTYMTRQVTGTCGLAGISGNAEDVRAMVETVLQNWDLDKFKPDDELGVAWKSREKDIRDLYSDR